MARTASSPPNRQVVSGKRRPCRRAATSLAENLARAQPAPRPRLRQRGRRTRSELAHASRRRASGRLGRARRAGEPPQGPVAPPVRRSAGRRHPTGPAGQVATALLAKSRVPVRRREVQDELVCAFDRVHADYGVTPAEFCAALSLAERTFRSWRARPPAPAVPPPLPPPPARPKNDRRTGRFDLDVTAPGTQLGGDTTDLRVLGVDLKLVGNQDLGAREQRLF